jgi:hypothetical protein
MTDEAWIDALQQRHRAALTNSEFLKAVRALSARYVERRSSIRERSPLDSDGKKAAFAAFYAPLHFLTAREIVRQLSLHEAPISRIVDLGCGTGVVSAAWALDYARAGARELRDTPGITGVDAHPWALSEASWNWRQLELHGDTKRGDMGTWRPSASAKASAGRPNAIVAGWSINELTNEARARLLPELLNLSSRGAHVLVIEPLAKSAVPWWNDWATAFGGAGGRADEWRFETDLPATLREISEAAGFRREGLTARTLFIAPAADTAPTRSGSSAP